MISVIHTSGRSRTTAAFLMLSCIIIWVARGVAFEYYPPGTDRWTCIIFEYPGASAELLEESIIRPFEEFTAGIAGIREQQVIIHDGRARYYIGHHPSVSPVDALVQIRGSLKRLDPILPAPARRPVIESGGQSENPVLIIGLTPAPGMSVETLVQVFSGIEGCSRVETCGHEHESLYIETREDASNTALLSIQDILTALSGRTASGSLTLESGEFLVLDSRPWSMEDYRNITLRPYLRLGETADVGMRTGKEYSASLINGQKQAVVLLYAEDGADIIKLCCAGVRAARSIPGADPVVLYDLGHRTRENLTDMLFNTAAGIVIVILVTILLLRDLKAAALASLTIPFSLFATAAVFRITGTSLNMVTISGLAVANGLVMDGSYIVITHLRTAGISGLRTCAAALLASVCTTAAVCVPVRLLTPEVYGPFGGLFSAVFWTLLAGYVYSLVFIPGLYTPPRSLPSATGGLMRGGAGALFNFGKRRPVLSTVYVASGCLVACFLLGYTPFERVPLKDTHVLNFQIEFPAGTPLDRMIRSAGPMEHALQEIPGVMNVSSRYRDEQIRICLSLATRTSEETVADKVQRLHYLIPGGDIHIPKQSGRKDMEVRVYGPDNILLRSIAADLGGHIEEKFPGCKVILHFKEPVETCLLSINTDKTASAGITPLKLYQELYWKFLEPVGGKAFFSGGERDIHVTRTKPSGPVTLQEYLHTTLSVPGGHSPVGEFVSACYVPSTGTIYRYNRRRVQSLTLRFPERTSEKRIRSIIEYLAAYPVRDGYSIRVGSHSLEDQESRKRITISALAGTASVVLIIFFYFGSFNKALACLVIGLGALPLPVFLHIIVFQKAVSTPLVLGLLLVFGVQVNNGIILLRHREDTPGDLFVRLCSKAEAILGAAITSTAGILPLLVLESETRRFMAALLGTLAAGTLYGTLILPVLLGAFQSRIMQKYRGTKSSPSIPSTLIRLK